MGNLNQKHEQLPVFLSIAI